MEQITFIIAVIAGVAGGVWTLALWMTRQHASIKALIYEQFEKMLNRFESHERHDNARFSEVNNRLWELRLETAGIHKKRSRMFPDPQDNNNGRNE